MNTYTHGHTDSEKHCDSSFLQNILVNINIMVILSKAKICLASIDDNNFISINYLLLLKLFSTFQHIMEKAYNLCFKKTEITIQNT